MRQWWRLWARAKPRQLTPEEIPISQRERRSQDADNAKRRKWIDLADKVLRQEKREQGKSDDAALTNIREKNHR